MNSQLSQLCQGSSGTRALKFRYVDKVCGKKRKTTGRVSDIEDGDRVICPHFP